MIHVSSVLFGLALLMPQDAPPAPATAQPQNPAPANPAPQNPGGPQLVPQQPGQVPQNMGRTIASVKDYRGGSDGCPYVRRAEDVRDVDLSKVDFEAAVVARVNGREITRDQLRMWVAFNSGYFGVQNELTRVLTQKAVEASLKDRPQDAPQFLVTDEDVATRLKSEEDQARAQGEAAYKGYVEQIERSMGWERYREFVKTQLQSERLLLPPVSPPLKPGEVADPNAEIAMLPPESAALLDDQAPLRDYLADSYLKRQELAPLFRVQFLRMLQDKMVERASVKYAIEEQLPTGVFMQVEGTDIPVDRILDFAAADRQQWERSLRLALLYVAVDDELSKHDSLLSPQAFAGAFTSHEAEFANTLFPLKNLIQLRGFLNMAEYRQYYMRRLGFQKYLRNVVLKGDPAAYEAELQRHHAQFGRLFYESGRVSVELMFASVEECEKANPGADGWACAQERIIAAYDALTAKESPLSFADARAKFSHPIASIPDGMLAQKVRNEMRMTLGETEYNIFVDGYSLSDDAYYNRVEGEVFGPVRMRNTPLTGQRSGLGYLIGKVGEFRTTAALKDFATQRALVETDYIDLRFTYFAHECLKNAKIDLIEKK